MMKLAAPGLTVAVLLCGSAAPAGAQQTYPDKAIRIVVGFPPGGATDLLARDIGPRFTAKWGQPAVVDNRPGANGNIGAEFVAKSKPDGHTLLIQPANIAISATLYKNLGYDVFRDLTPVTMLATGPYIMVAPAALPVRSLRDVIGLAKSKPGELLMASTGLGSPGHLAGELLQAALNVRFTHIPYKGQGPALIDLMSGQVMILFASAPAAAPHLATGRIRAIAVTTTKRATLLPEIPTIAESGFPGFNVGAWHGALVQARTPREIIVKLHDELAQFVRSPEAKKFYTQQGLELMSSSPEEFGAFLKSEVSLYAKVTGKLNVQLN
jgi:tripartite-type tricarboxylate transporter receptor subunit TctC